MQDLQKCIKLCSRVLTKRPRSIDPNAFRMKTTSCLLPVLL